MPEVHYVCYGTASVSPFEKHLCYRSNGDRNASVEDKFLYTLFRKKEQRDEYEERQELKGYGKRHDKRECLQLSLVVERQSQKDHQYVHHIDLTAGDGAIDDKRRE